MKSVRISLALMAGLAGAVIGYFALAPADKLTGDTFAARPVWAEQKWPFPMDQWGTGRVFECTAPKLF